MSKYSVFATVLAAALSWGAVSCTGPVFIHPPAATGAAAPAAAATTTSGTANPLANTSPWAGSSIFVAGAVGIFVVLGVSMYAFRGKPDTM